MKVGTNRLLCDADVAPDGTVVVIEDVGAKGVSGIYVDDDVEDTGEVGTQCHALWVHTMSVHECALVGRGVRVRVLGGSNPGGLGVLAYDGQLEVASGVLAIGDAHNPGRQLLFGSPAVVRVSVFLDDTIGAIRFDDRGSEYPLSGPSDVNMLIHGEPGFAHAVCSPRTRRPWRRW